MEQQYCKWEVIRELGRGSQGLIYNCQVKPGWDECRTASAGKQGNPDLR